MRALRTTALCLLLGACRTAPVAAPSLRWEDWGPAAFERAATEHKLVLLDLHAVWCHWCHVMEETTYRDEHVTGLLGRHFVLVGVDQDARPDLSNRYEDYGWPATIVFAPDGRELAKLSGYIEPAELYARLAALVADPTPGPSARAATPAPAASASGLSPELCTRLAARADELYDERHAGFGFGHKYLDAPGCELLIDDALRGSARARERAQATLAATSALIDPVWGGIYQYSVGGDWHEPHFEKIMSFQADALRTYALGASAFGDARLRTAAEAVARNLEEFLSRPEGAFYTSQDADLVPGEHSAGYFALDDRARRALGVPRVDTHVYARENGWAIRGLCALHDASGDERFLERARRAAEWILAARALEGGGFRHGERDTDGPYLGDSLALGQAFLALYESSAERVWLARALEASDFMAREFAAADPAGGYLSAARAASVPGLPPQAPQRDENAALARLENALFQYTGVAAHRERSERALRWLGSADVALRGSPALLLLCSRESAADPAHVTVVGAKDDPDARALYAAALGLPLPYRRIEWLDAAEGALPRADVEYPELGRAAAFVCRAGRCSAPAFDAQQLIQRVLPPGR